MDILQLNVDKQLELIISEYMNTKMTPVIYGFNIFPAISDTYYKENFHSDILKAFLSTNSQSEYEFGMHCDGDIYLQVFIQMINAAREEHGRSLIDGDLYKTAIVEREPHRIDILIKGENHCIIIENKINNAVDQNRQLPRYYEKMIEDGYSVDAVVYLTKTPEQMPELYTWLPEEKKAILPILSFIPVNDEENRISLLNNWIMPCSKIAIDSNCTSSLRQYGSLIEYLTPDFKKDKAMRNLLEYLRKYPSFIGKEVIPAQMAHQLPDMMARELRERVRALIQVKDLTVNVGSWSPNSCVINLDNADNQIWTYCCADAESAYRLGFRGCWHVGDPTNYWVDWYPISERDVEVSIDQNGAYLSRDFPFGKKGEEDILNFISKLLDLAVSGDK